MSSPPRSVVLLLGSLSLIAGTIVACFWWSRPIEESLVSPPGNRAEGPRFVGVRRCAECHPDKAASFGATSHARTFRLTSAGEDFAFLQGRTARDEDWDVTFRYAFNDSRLTVSLPEQFPGREFPLPFALGSGTHAVTFLTLIPNHLGETVGVEHRVSVFDGGHLARTPAATSRPPQQDVEYFGEIIEGERLHDCIGCHITRCTLGNADVQDLLPNVQCERCHGAGSDHVAAMERGDSLLAIDFGPGTKSALEEVQMCGRCHRLPEMLSETPLDRTSVKLARHQSVGLLQSACFRKSNETLRCTSCHDPHVRADSLSRAAYSAICLRCHQDLHVADCPHASPQDCIRCHMPRIEVHPRISFHDHWIRIRDEQDPATSEASAIGAASGDRDGL